MRMISATIRGIGRIVDTKINLDSKLIAIVGPNEAGKTTLLKALSMLETDDALPKIERSRALTENTHDNLLEIQYVLDSTDIEALATIELSELPIKMIVYRKIKGDELYYNIQPRPKKPFDSLSKAVKSVTAASQHNDFLSLIEENDEQASISASLSKLLKRMEQAGQAGKLQEDEAESALDELKKLKDMSKETKRGQKLAADLGQIIEWLEAEDPSQKVLSILSERRPEFVMFDDANRALESEYILDSNLSQDAPLALKNLAFIARLDLGGLHRHSAQGDIARRDELLDSANANLKEVFNVAWTQSQLTVRLTVDGDFLRIIIVEDGVGLSVFDERSAGLKMFVALTTFLKAQSHNSSVILLIDEAENHLHIDAQADLVEMLTKQAQAKKVIYTTHSPACLPSDLGTGVRLLVPNPQCKRRSDVKNSFWDNAAGFSPLMMAMGAGSAAFSAARCVVLAEGASEMILLPSLLRAANSLENLPYQIAPGLSETPKKLFPELDFSGAHVAYCVDSDEGGKHLKKSLMKEGVPSDLIISSGMPGLENLLDPNKYRSAIQALLNETELNCEEVDIPIPTNPAKESWALQYKRILEKHGIKNPSKVAVASWLIENEFAIPSSSGKRKLIQLHENLLKALGLEEIKL